MVFTPIIFPAYFLLQNFYCRSLIIINVVKQINDLDPSYHFIIHFGFKSESWKLSNFLCAKILLYVIKIFGVLGIVMPGFRQNAFRCHVAAANNVFYTFPCCDTMQGAY